MLLEVGIVGCLLRRKKNIWRSSGYPANEKKAIPMNLGQLDESKQVADQVINIIFREWFTYTLVGPLLN
jgi:hypothetical protein